MQNLKKISKFHLFYLGRPWPSFNATLLGACQKADEKFKKHPDVGLINEDEAGVIRRVNFHDILMKLKLKKRWHVERAKNIK